MLDDQHMRRLSISIAKFDVGINSKQLAIHGKVESGAAFKIYNIWGGTTRQQKRQDIHCHSQAASMTAVNPFVPRSSLLQPLVIACRVMSSETLAHF
ncbi:hypothetical protein PC116_g5851 [Phytophthora cactorum]|uniref:Uncharacterized protein n=1 Tax=Phytophthora cactorum TaxID=29920 RepID=A0A8T1CYA2_9STRA|nr:hypothetical protein Pcac1_g5436 [Phytophthora cactorum]KAG2835247.1 hypothetical protein PC112_g5757 [Phytophthora cactorum]KAG2902496.1 hypothetical protein PC114_g12710 [Phytophthora cactorum]KAG2928934.1 hypothetical protein PC115_g7095 [Phytophthora cactorum]KAG2941637.1 hypothetical protein PC117_g10138 [Phytophthora cactorum]